MAELNVNIGNLPLKNPIMTASGTFGYGIEYADFMDISRLGGTGEQVGKKCTEIYSKLY